MENTLSPELITMIRREIAASLHCALPGIVESFDPDLQTVDVRPALRSRLPDGSQVQFPLVRNVPIFYPGSRSAAMTYPVAAGDECLLIFADSAIDGWYQTGSDPLPPSERHHALSDAFAFIGFRSQPNALAPVSDTPDYFGRFQTLETAIAGYRTQHRYTLTLKSGWSASECYVYRVDKVCILVARALAKATSATGSGWVTFATVPDECKPSVEQLGYLSMDGASWSGGKTYVAEFHVLSNGNLQIYGPSAEKMWGSAVWLCG